MQGMGGGMDTPTYESLQQQINMLKQMQQLVKPADMAGLTDIVETIERDMSEAYVPLMKLISELWPLRMLSLITPPPNHDVASPHRVPARTSGSDQYVRRRRLELPRVNSRTSACSTLAVFPLGTCWVPLARRPAPILPEFVIFSSDWPTHEMDRGSGAKISAACSPC